MPVLNDKNREIWSLLFTEGRALTVAEIAARVEQPSDVVFWGVSGMARRELVKVHPNPKERRLRYGIDGTCLVPQGMRLAEVQA